MSEERETYMAGNKADPQTRRLRSNEELYRDLISWIQGYAAASAETNRHATTRTMRDDFALIAAKCAAALEAGREIETVTAPNPILADLTFKPCSE